MGELCRTTATDKWDSFIADTKEGAFTVDVEDEEGFFEGVFFDGTVQERIRGKCDGSNIYFLRSADKPRYYYSGKFDGERTIIGTRTTLPETEGESLRNEEWEGTKIPTETQADPARAT